MKLSVERNPGSIAVLDITADDDEFAQAMKVAYRKVSKDAQVPGFRKGKAPRHIIERMYGHDVFVREAADEIMEKLYRDALKQEDLTPVGDPEVEIKELEPINFVVTVPVYPELTLGDYAGVRVEPEDASVEESEVQEVIDRLQLSQSPWADPKEPRPAKDGDQVTVDYEVKEGDTAFQEPVTDAVFVLGETNLLAPLREKIESMQVGETETFDIPFAEDDESVDPTVRGKTLTYTVTLKSIKERDILPLDDEFAKTVADAESMDDLRQQIRDDIHQGKTNDARTKVLNQIIEEMGKVSTLDLPEAMIHDEVHHQLEHLKQDLARNGTPFEGYLAMQGKTEESLHDELWPESEKRLRNSMLMQEVAKQESIEVSDEDLDAEVERLIGANSGLAAAGDDDEANAQIQRMRDIYKSDYFRDMLRNELFERKLTDRLIEIATEGRGAVVNGYVAPEPSDDEAASGVIDVEGEVADNKETATEAAEAAADHTFAEAAGEAEPEPSAEEAAEAFQNEPKASAAKKGGKELGPAEGEGSDWVAGDGTDTIPAGFPIKGNASSRIYHTPDSPFYEATIAEVYFATPEAAEVAGYRLPKSMQAAAEDAVESAVDAAQAAAKTIDSES
ncbi:MAG: trigger factor [Thermomicrobiales bacterium]